MSPESNLLAEILFSYRGALEWLTVAIACIILLSSVDDLFIDAYYWVRRFYRRVIIRRRYAPLPIEALTEKPEGFIAIMVPAWKESDVIAAMLTTSKAPGVTSTTDFPSRLTR